MGTLYDLLGALPSDDAEELRTAFRKAAKATHPDTNPDNPDAALRFRELVRAYDILTDTDQRATYDQLMVIALQPPATQATRTYETVRKARFQHRGGNHHFGLAGRRLHRVWAVLEAARRRGNDHRRSADGALEMAALRPPTPAQEEPRVRRETEVTTGSAVAMAAAAPAGKQASAAPIGRFEAVPAFATYHLGVQHYPRFAAAYFDRGVVPYRLGASERPLTDVTAARRAMGLKQTKTAARLPRRPLVIVPVLPERRERITEALTP